MSYKPIIYTILIGLFLSCSVLQKRSNKRYNAVDFNISQLQLTSDLYGYYLKCDCDYGEMYELKRNIDLQIKIKEVMPFLGMSPSGLPDSIIDNLQRDKQEICEFIKSMETKCELVYVAPLANFHVASNPKDTLEMNFIISKGIMDYVYRERPYKRYYRKNKYYHSPRIAYSNLKDSVYYLPDTVVSAEYIGDSIRKELYHVKINDDDVVLNFVLPDLDVIYEDWPPYIDSVRLNSPEGYIKFFVFDFEEDPAFRVYLSNNECYRFKGIKYGNWVYDDFCVK